MPEETLKIAEKRREVKGKGERERFTHLNAEFQRITRRDKKTFLSEQCKEIAENKEWERLEISSRKLEIPREHFMQRCHDKGQKWPGPRRRRGDKKLEKNCTKKVLTTTHDGVVTHLEPDILECEVKWALESITTNKASGGDGFQLSYFKS